LCNVIIGDPPHHEKSASGNHAASEYIAFRAENADIGNIKAALQVRITGFYHRVVVLNANQIRDDYRPLTDNETGKRYDGK